MSLPTLTVEIAFYTNPDVAVPEWEDVSEWVMGGSISRGRQTDLDQVQAGVCQLRLANGDRRFDPTYTHSPYHPDILPMRKIRVSATWISTTYYLFTGYVESWPILWEAPKWGSVTITAVDGMAALEQAAIDGTFPQETSGSRIDRVLSAAAWPDSTPAAGGYWTLGTSQLGTTTILSYGIPNAVLADGQSEIQAVTIDEGSAVSALSHIHETVAAERGMFFIDGQGRAVFHDRLTRYNAASEVTFTDANGTLTADVIPYSDLRPVFEIDRVVNHVSVTRTGGTAQTVTDSASRTQYFRRTLTLTPPLTTDAEALDRANYELWLRKQPRQEFDQVVLRPQGNDASWPHVLIRELGDRVSVERTPGSVDAITPETIERDGFVEAVEHRFTPAEWTTTFQLSPADQYDQFFTLGVAGLDSNTSAVLAY